MYNSVYDLKAFYASRKGRLIRRLLLARLRAMWTDGHGMRLVGVGYAVPYLRGIGDGAERIAALMPHSLGVHSWPERENGLTCLNAEAAWPLETESIDRLLLIHSLEHAQMPQELLAECWRVLKSQGRLMIVVPNRLGLWARADWTPFGHGRPYTAGQVSHYLQESLFAVERTEQALFMPPFKSFSVLRSAYLLENMGQRFFPGLAGIHLVEASKQVYAGIRRPRAAEAVIKRPVFASTPIPT